MSHVSSQQRPWRAFGVLVLVYLLVTIIITWPVALHLRSVVFAQAGDPFGTLFSLWQSRFSWPPLTFPAAPFLVLTTTLLARAFGEVASFNVIQLSDFVLTGLAGYVLARRLTANRWAAFMAGLVLMLSPFHVSRSLQHLGLANLEWLIFFVASVLWFDEQPTVGRGALVGLLFAITTLDSYLYGLFALVMVIVFEIWKLGGRLLDRGDTQSRAWPVATFGGLVAGVLVAAVLIFPAVRPLLSPIRHGQPIAAETLTPVRSLQEAGSYSAQWFAYALPSPDNPLFGRWTAGHYAASLAATGSNLTELTLYPGWITIGLALLAVTASGAKQSQVWDRHGQEPRDDELSNNDRRSRQPQLVWLFALLTLAGLWLSFAPTLPLGPWHVPTLAPRLVALLPFLRVFSRFGLVVLIGLAGLAAIGLGELLAHLPTKRWQVGVAGGLLLLSLAELLVWPAARTVAVGQSALPAAYRQLPRESRIAEYPLLPADEPAGEIYLLWDRLTGASLLNADPAQSAGQLAGLHDLRRSKTISDLLTDRIQFVLVHRELYTPALIHKQPGATTNGVIPTITDPRATLIGQFGSVDVYELHQ